VEMMTAHLARAGLDFSASHVQWMALVVIEDESLDPGNLRLFGAERVVLVLSYDGTGDA